MTKRESIRHQIIVPFLHWVNRRLNALFERFDICHVCGEEAENWCSVCDRRHCDEHESHYYEDVEMCSTCRAAITPEEEERDRKEALADTCEQGCHKADCPCVRVHDVHTEECSGCKCFESDEPCDMKCKPTGYTFANEEVPQ